MSYLLLPEEPNNRMSSFAFPFISRDMESHQHLMDLFDEYGIEYRTLNSYLDKEDNLHIEKNAQKLLDQWKNIQGNNKLSKSMVYHGVHVYSLVEKRLLSFLPKQIFGSKEIGFVRCFIVHITA